MCYIERGDKTEDYIRRGFIYAFFWPIGCAYLQTGAASGSEFLDINDEVRHSRNFDPSDEFHAWTTSILASFSFHVHSTVPASFTVPLRISSSTYGLTGDSD
jgi:hypothetical protein